MSSWNLGLLGAAGPGIPGVFELAETVTLDSARTSVTFSSLNTAFGNTYQHFQIRMTARSNRSGTNEDHFYVRFNGDATANYRHHYLTGTGSTVVSGDPTSTFPNGAFSFFGVTAATSDANSFGSSIVDILDPFETTKNKTLRMFNGSTNINRIALGSALWISTSAVTTLEIVCAFGSFVQGSRFSLYGMRNANV